jgi:hypothetical protein
MSTNYPTELPAVVGIGAYRAGTIHWNEDDGVQLTLHKAWEAWDGYVDDQLVTFPGTTIPIEVDPYQPRAVAEILRQKRPDLHDVLEGMNDTDEAGYVVAVSEDKQIEALVVRADTVMGAKRIMSRWLQGKIPTPPTNYEKKLAARERLESSPNTPDNLDALRALLP